uniref:DUF4351 domain-containing protein n=1 Tax=Candidatus Kentrum sp. FW TaxID=2126338 RepID=A0A450SZP1_9GAMM|nr:MAG: protein of unknown function (DUF4351) [Candidatus Kentron sp. FW]VFJ68837.1 MAG: protein of unknown function (DUF4351) [Candidatus Kentron sp. FW]
MLTRIDMTRIPSYQLGMEKGREQGREEGEAALLTRQLSLKFGSLPQVVDQRIKSARANELTTWGEKVLTAKSLDEVFL